MSPTVKRFSMAAAVLVLAGCMSKTSESARKEANELYAIVDTAGATGTDSVRLKKLHCANTASATDTLTVLPGDPDTAIAVDGHRLEIPRGAVSGKGTTFIMTHAADPNELRVELETVPKVNGFGRRLTLALSYTSCMVDRVDLERVHVLRNDRYDRGGKHDAGRKAIRAQLSDLSTYSLAIP